MKRQILTLIIRWSLVRAQVGPQQRSCKASLFLVITMAETYILYSETLSKFYVGACHEDLEMRIENHNTGKYGSKTYTSQVNDWQLFLKFNCDNYPHAVRLERKIKSMKSSKHIRNLLKYPELRQKILGEKRKV